MLNLLCRMAERCIAALKSSGKPKGKSNRVVNDISLVLSSHTVLVIAGSTSVGKTNLSLELASRLGGEVVSADSAQVIKIGPIKEFLVQNLSISIVTMTFVINIL